MDSGLEDGGGGSVMVIMHTEKAPSLIGNCVSYWLDTGAALCSYMETKYMTFLIELVSFYAKGQILSSLELQREDRSWKGETNLRKANKFQVDLAAR